MRVMHHHGRPHRTGWTGGRGSMPRIAGPKGTRAGRVGAWIALFLLAFGPVLGWLVAPQSLSDFGWLVALAATLCSGAVVAQALLARSLQSGLHLDEPSILRRYLDAGPGPTHRDAFDRRVQRAVIDAQARGRPMALLVLSLDGFADFALQHGTEAAECESRAVARRVGQCIRESDFAAPIEPGRVAVVVPRLARPDVVGRLADALLAAVRGTPTASDAKRAWTASIGIALCPEDSVQAEELHRCAERALQIAQSTGGDEYWSFSAGDPSVGRPSRL